MGHHRGKQGEDGSEEEEKVEDGRLEEEVERVEIVGVERNGEGGAEDQKQPEDEGAPEAEGGEEEHDRLFGGRGEIGDENTDRHGDHSETPDVHRSDGEIGRVQNVVENKEHDQRFVHRLQEVEKEPTHREESMIDAFAMQLREANAVRVADVLVENRQQKRTERCERRVVPENRDVGLVSRAWV